MIFKNVTQKTLKLNLLLIQHFSCLNQREESFSEGLKTEKLRPINFGEK